MSRVRELLFPMVARWMDGDGVCLQFAATAMTTDEQPVTSKH